MELLSFAAAAASWVLVARQRCKKRPRAVISDRESVLLKCEKIVDGGASALQIIMDFDRTMTTFVGPNGHRGASCHGIVETRRSEELKAKAEAFNAFYYPIEVDPHRTKEEKVPYMEDWYRNINSLLTDSGMRQCDLAEDVSRANVMLRPGITSILDFAKHYDVPVTIFSAGIGDVIAEVLHQKYGALPPRCRIVSNWMTWESSNTDGNGAGTTFGSRVQSHGGGEAVTNAACGRSPSSGSACSSCESGTSSTTATTLPASSSLARITGWTEPLVHMFNKDCRHIVEQYPHSFENDLRPRRNVVLLGDGLGDVTMADGLPTAAVMRVGFLNDNIDMLLERYIAAYDVVITHDGPADGVVRLLHRAVDAWRAEKDDEPYWKGGNG